MALAREQSTSSHVWALRFKGPTKKWLGGMEYSAKKYEPILVVSHEGALSKGSSGRRSC